MNEHLHRTINAKPTRNKRLFWFYGYRFHGYVTYLQDGRCKLTVCKNVHGYEDAIMHTLFIPNVTMKRFYSIVLKKYYIKAIREAYKS